MKPAMTLIKIFILILMTGLSACAFYGTFMGCGEKVFPEIVINTQDVGGQYYFPETQGENTWQVDLDEICSSVHLPYVEIRWKIFNDMLPNLISITGSADIGFSTLNLEKKTITDAKTNTTEFIFSAEDVGIKQWFEEGEPGWLYLILNVKMNSTGDDNLDLEYLKVNWISCTFKAEYFEYKESDE